MSRTVVYVLLAWLTLTDTCARADPPTRDGTAQEQTSDARRRQEIVAEIQRLIREANQLKSAARVTEAIKAGERAAGLAREVDGDVSEGVASLQDWLAAVYEIRQDWPAARKAREEALTIRGSLYGEKDWRVTDARLAVADVDVRMRLSPKQRLELADSDRLTSQARTLRQMGEAGKGIPLANRALEIRQRLLGHEHSQVASSLNDLGGLYSSMRQDAQAESFYRQALEIRRKILGDDHPETALCLQSLAFIDENQGEIAKAEGLYLEALEIRRKTLGERHNATAQSFDSLVSLRGKLAAQKMERADFASARQTQGDLLKLLAERYGERNWRVTDARLSLADVDLRERLSPDDRGQLKTAAEQDRERRRLFDQGHFREALIPAERALAIRRKVVGNEHRDTARSLNELGSLYVKLKQYAKVEPIDREMLAIRMKLLGEEHPDTALTLNNMGKVFELEGDDAKAEPYFRRALVIRSKVLVPRHADTLASFDSLASIEGKLVGRNLAEGKYAEAAKVQDGLISLLAARYGERDWRVTNARLKRSDIDLEESLSPEARAQLKEADRHEAARERFSDQGRFRDALAETEQALEIRKKIQGDRHPATATCLNSAAVLNNRLDEHAKAETLYKQAIEIRRKVLGEIHPETALCLGNLAEMYAAKEEFDKAEPLWRRALEIRLRTDGEKGADTGTAWDRLIVLRETMITRLLEKSDYASARKIQSDTLRLLARRYGEQDWHVTDARLKLRDIEFEEKLAPEGREQLRHIHELVSVCARLFNQGRYREALVPAEQALAIRKKILGETHPDTAANLNFVAVLYEDLHADAKVEPLYQQALQIRKKTLGEQHPLTAASLENLALFYDNRGKLDQAEPLYRQTLSIRQRILGEKDNATVATFNKLMSVYRRKAFGDADAADYAAARRVQEESIRLLTRRYGQRNWQVTDARLKLRDMELRQHLTAEGRADLRKAAELDAEQIRLFEQERYRESLVPALEALEIRKRVLGMEHPDTAGSFNLVGVLYGNVKDYAKAELHYREALEVREKLLGDEHPDTATSLNNLAVVCQYKGDDARAEPLYLKAVEIRMRVLGKGHNLTISTFNDLVTLQPKMVARSLAAGDYSTARRIQDELVRVLFAKYGGKDRRFERARAELRDIESREKLSAEAREDLKKAERRISEGRQFIAKQQYREAVAPALEVFDIRLKALGPAHADTVASFNNLEAIYDKVIGESLARDDYSSAARIEAGRARLLGQRYTEKDWRAVEARLKQQDYEKCAQFAPAGRASLRRKDQLEKEFVQQDSKGAYRDALRSAEEGLAISRKIFGDSHLETARWINLVGVAHSRFKENAVAESHCQQALEIARKVLGTEHPQTAVAVSNLARLYNEDKKFEKALPLFREALAIQKRVLGEASFETRAAFDDLTGFEQAIANQHLAKGDYDSARRTYDDLIGLLRQRYGEKNWHVTDARLNQRDAELLQRLSPEQRAELKKAEELDKQQAEKYEKNQYADALALERQVLEIRKRILGDEHRETAKEYATIGMTLGDMGDGPAARTMLERALALRRKIFGEEHDDTRISYNYLALNLENAGEYAAAIDNAEKALAIQRKIAGEDDSETAACQMLLGDLFSTTGEFTIARGYFERALATWRKTNGENDPNAASIYRRLGNVFLELGDYSTARRNIERALAIQIKARGEEDFATAELHNSLANLNSATGDYASARTDYERALAICRKLGGDDGLIAATSYAGLSMVSRSLQDYQAARQNAERMLAISRKLCGEDDLWTARSYNELGVILQELGEFAESRRNYELALAIDRKVLGEEHKTTALLHHYLGTLCLDQGDYTAALAEQQQALAITHGFLSRMFGALSEDQQLALQDNVRFCLDEYLTAASFTHADDAAVYGWLLKCKGAVTAEQFLIRLQRRKAGVAQLFDELQATSTRLSALDGELSQSSTSSSDPKQREQKLGSIQQEIRQLNARNEALQQQLVARNSGFRQAKESANLRPEDIRKALPAHSALVDFVEYSHSLPLTVGKGRPAAEKRLMAFVIRPERPIHRIDLGSADNIAAKIDAWNRAVIGSRNSNGGDALREELGTLIWKPLVPYLDRAETIVISPDGSLCQFPFAVLPGTKPESYLLEERKLAVIPVPRLLPQLLAQSYAAADATVSSAPLLIGNVDYESDPGTIVVARNDVRDRSRSREPVASRAGERLEFKYLPGTKEEMEAIDQLYRRNFPGHEPHVLAGLEATEQAFRDKAPRHRWVHLATHGYFIPPPETDRTKPVEDLLGAKQEMHSSHPGLWSGIALSGANGRRETDPSPAGATEGKPPRDDGKLTALEVEGLDLMDVDLIVLSACQTALGRLTQGEGMLGLQRAFQLAGAKTAVTSLWTVDDTATRVLMTEFYKNLWGKKLPKLEALRQAQLLMLREYDPSQRKLISRGLDIPETETVSHKRGSPYYWAAFVMSGDWR
jgi:CHAT domain-containing protein